MQEKMVGICKWMLWVCDELCYVIVASRLRMVCVRRVCVRVTLHVDSKIMLFELGFEHADTKFCTFSEYMFLVRNIQMGFARQNEFGKGDGYFLMIVTNDDEQIEIESSSN